MNNPLASLPPDRQVLAIQGIGTIVLTDARPGASLSEKQVALLRTFARVAPLCAVLASLATLTVDMATLLFPMMLDFSKILLMSHWQFEAQVFEKSFCVALMTLSKKTRTPS